MAGDYGLQLVDISNLAVPVALGVASGGDVRDVVMNGNFAFLADYSRSFTVVDITNPALPVVGASTDQSLGGLLQDVVLSGAFAFGADVRFVNGVPIIDVSNPTTPQPRAILDFSQFRDDNGTGIAVDSSFIYLTAEQGSLSENGTAAGNTRLYIGQYRALEDRFGIPPSISVTSPANGDTVIQQQQLPIMATASDDVAVAGVTFAVNGVDIGTDTTAPYEMTYAVPAQANNLTITANAIDLGGNIASSIPFTVTAIPDPLTTVIGVVVDSKGNVLSGVSVTCQGITATSSTDGSFSIPGQPTLQGDIRCTANFKNGNVTLTGVSNAVSPVRGGTTNMGKITAQAGLSRGRDFWFAHQKVYSAGAQLIILSDMPANFTISATGFSYTGTATADAPAVVPIPNSLQVETDQVIESKGIHLASDTDITALLYLNAANTNDIALLIPTASLGEAYEVVGYSGYPSEFLLAATQNNTNISFNPPCGSQAGNTVKLSLNAGDAYQYQCSGGVGDVTGTSVQSDQPLGVIAGAGCADVPVGVVACDVLSEMLFPVANLYGTEFYSAPLPGNTSDVFRIIAVQDGTVVTVNQGGTKDTYTLNHGQFQELRIEPGAHFTSNLPISVTQYAVGGGQAKIGDPFQMQLIPTQAYKTAFRFYTPSEYTDSTYAIITAPNAAVSSVTLNGVAVTGFQALPDGSQQYVVVAVPKGQSVITASQPIAAYGIGFGYYVSYGYPAGF